MNIRVIFFGTLRKQFPDHDPTQGIEIDIPEGSTVEDLIMQLDFPLQKLGMVAMNGRLVKAGNLLKKNAVVRVFQPIFGG